jgi:hypothetical protein
MARARERIAGFKVPRGCDREVAAQRCPAKSCAGLMRALLGWFRPTGELGFLLRHDTGDVPYGNAEIGADRGCARIIVHRGTIDASNASLRPVRQQRGALSHSYWPPVEVNVRFIKRTTAMVFGASDPWVPTRRFQDLPPHCLGSGTSPADTIRGGWLANVPMPAWLSERKVMFIVGSATALPYTLPTDRHAPPNHFGLTICPHVPSSGSTIQTRSTSQRSVQKPVLRKQGIPRPFT